MNKILIVEDSKSLCKIYDKYLSDDNNKIIIANSLREAERVIANESLDIIILDLKLPDGDGTLLIKKLQSNESIIPIIVMTAHGTIERAVDAMKLGAFDFLEKPFNAQRLKSSVSGALFKIKKSGERQNNGVKDIGLFDIIGKSEAMKNIYTLIKKVGPSKASVLITGESGTGKELIAKALHETSSRSDKPFIAINCAAIPKDLMESEIFGHTKGAFTGATSERDGAAIKANGGTLFLDEIGELDINIQAKLLRFIQTGEVKKVGATKNIQTDIRFISATNRNPKHEIMNGNFREDLYYRLNVISIHSPPLRDRGEDILLILDRLLKKYFNEEGKEYKPLSSEARTYLLNYKWEGNVRELQNLARSLAVLTEGTEITIEDLPNHLHN